MDQYIVSARKYRPATFESVVGQRALTDTLRNAIRSGHLAHAYLFCGPRGVLGGPDGLDGNRGRGPGPGRVFLPAADDGGHEEDGGKRMSHTVRIWISTVA